jgi:hypothetical protein
MFSVLIDGGTDTLAAGAHGEHVTHRKLDRASFLTSHGFPTRNFDLVSQIVVHSSLLYMTPDHPN